MVLNCTKIMKKLIAILCLIVCSANISWARQWTIQPKNSGIKILDVKKGVRWQTTRTTYRSFYLLKEAFLDGDPLGILIAVVGTPISSAFLVAGPPIDLVTTPLRWKNTFDMEVSGKLMKGSVPISNATLGLSADAWSTNDLLPFHVFTSSAAAVTGPNGEFSTIIRTTLGANVFFEMKLTCGNMPMYSWLIFDRGKRRLEVHKYPLYPYEIIATPE